MVLPLDSLAGEKTRTLLGLCGGENRGTWKSAAAETAEVHPENIWLGVTAFSLAELMLQH